MRLLTAGIIVLVFAFPVFAQDKIRLPCEVMEISPPFQTQLSRLEATHYLLIHHANAADRQAFSKWLKAHSGAEIQFIVDGNRYRGVLCRLGHCFGRGLLIYLGPVKVERLNVIDVILPVVTE